MYDCGVKLLVLLSLGERESIYNQPCFVTIIDPRCEHLVKSCKSLKMVYIFY